MRKLPILRLMASAIVLFAGGAFLAHAFDASSADFYVRQNVVQTPGFATSADFQNIQNSGQAATGISTSTSFGLRAGSLFILKIPVKPQYEQKHFHWRNNDGTESTATSATGGVQDTGITNVAKGAVERLRVEIANSGGTILGFSTQQFRIEYALQGSGCSSASYTDVGAAGGDWDMIASQLVDGSDTTNIAVATGGVTDGNNQFLTPNEGQRETTSQTGSLSVASNQFVELEYSMQALAAATDGATYCFRVTNAGSFSNFLYTNYATATLSAGSSVSCTTNVASTAFGTLTNASVATAAPNASTTMTCTGSLGCTLFVSDAGNATNGGLATSSPAYLIPSPASGFPSTATLVAGTEGYGIQATTTSSGNGATLGVASIYNSYGGAAVGKLATTTQVVASSTAPVTGREVLVAHEAAVSVTTPPASYADTITYSCLGN